MARVSAPLMSLEATGRLAQIEFKPGRSGTSVSALSTSRQPRSASQLLVRALLTQFESYWRTDQDDVQSNWAAIADSPSAAKALFLKAAFTYTFARGITSQPDVLAILPTITPATDVDAPYDRSNWFIQPPVTAPGVTAVWYGDDLIKRYSSITRRAYSDGLRTYFHPRQIKLVGATIWPDSGVEIPVASLHTTELWVVDIYDQATWTQVDHLTRLYHQGSLIDS